LSEVQGRFGGWGVVWGEASPVFGGARLLFRKRGRKAGNWRGCGERWSLKLSFRRRRWFISVVVLVAVREREKETEEKRLGGKVVFFQKAKPRSEKKGLGFLEVVLASELKSGGRGGSPPHTRQKA